ncbi:hypothetical protein SSS_10079 [Sarcoptes scabiei]|uniref:Large ribosomal subunit protein bL28m n=1 Tax=Sarcoptes scabiei TaxID=52283 RepID=A0A834R7J7_SARSC|nr:hypothetical protein SSS_10079 [Sarcoptes scabiei]
MVRYGRVTSWSFPHYISRLPDHYYKHVQDLNRPSERVHDRSLPTDLLDYKYDQRIARVIRIPDVPIPVLYPKEADEGLWGGEGIVKGYVKPRKYFQAGWPRPKYWFPNLKKVVFYSEILDKHFSIICTELTLRLIDQNHGFDNYILRTNVQDLKSRLGLLLRRQMLLTLAKKEFRDAEHEKSMMQKYGDCIIPLEEAEWFGLSVPQAINRMKILEAKNYPTLPMKYALTRKFIQDIEEQKSKADEDASKRSSNFIIDTIKSTFSRKKSSSPN